MRGCPRERGAARVSSLPPLYLITDGERLGQDRLLDAVEAACRAGLRMVQIREKNLDDEALRRLIRALRRRVPSETTLILNRRAQLAAELGLGGVHTGGEPGEVDLARRVSPPGFLVGYSAHAVDEARSALAHGADYVSFSPVFPPRSKRAVLPPVGLDGLRAACSVLSGPVYGLGGIDVDRVGAVREAGAAGVAVIGAILDEDDPGEEARALLRAWECGSRCESSRKGES